MHKDQTFLVDVPNGDYTVTLSIGDPKRATQNIDIYAQGEKKLDGVSTAAGEIARKSFAATVTNGQLSLDFKSRPSADGEQFWSVAALEVERVSKH